MEPARHACSTLSTARSTARRRFLLASATLAAGTWLHRPAGANTSAPRLVVIGGGWGGLSAARRLREWLPQASLTLIEKNTRFRACPLSNQWLVGRLDEAELVRDYTPAAQRFGYRIVHTAALSINRAAREVVTSDGRFPYDWLVLAEGIRHDWSAWFGADRAAADEARRRFPPAWSAAADEFAALRENLRQMRSGQWLMTVPPAPLRCPPAPYERALLLAGWLAERGSPVRILVLDANPPATEFSRRLREFGERIVYHAQTPVVGVDLATRTVATEFDHFHFDQACLLPPQQAGDLAWQAGLIGRDRDGRPTGWADVDPLTYASRADPQVFVVGDAIGHVSDVFGHYPKTAHTAVAQGRIAARQIAACVRGDTLAPELPDNFCAIHTRYQPPEALHLVSSHRLRGDGVIVQQQQTQQLAQPAGEDLAWLRGLLDEVLGPTR